MDRYVMLMRCRQDLRHHPMAEKLNWSQKLRKKPQTLSPRNRPECVWVPHSRRNEALHPFLFVIGGMKKVAIRYESLTMIYQTQRQLSHKIESSEMLISRSMTIIGMYYLTKLKRMNLTGTML